MERSTRRDAAIAAAVGVALGLGPLTSTHRSASIAGGVLAAAVVFAWRRRRGARARRRGESFDSRVLAPPPPAVWLALLLFAVVFAPTGAWLIGRWSVSIFHNSYGLLIPLLMVALAHGALARDAETAEEASPWGFAFLVVGLALAAADSGLGTHQLSVLGLITCLPGLSLLLLGARRTRALALPLALGIFLVPLPNVLATPLGLREITAAVAEPLLRAGGVPVLVDHLRLSLPSGDHYLVSDNCAGLQLLPAGLALALVLAGQARSRARAALLLVAALPLAIAANVVRSALLLALVHHAGSHLLQVPLVHGATGILAFWGLVAALLALAGPGLARRALA